ncbi:HAAS signaling domain-containing protein [Paenibacillus mendelii]|uniref:HAAS domain-containing protein n=1 Tax=Paenibacillus mendelii TaxID=206163 RepID=A0ABV6JD10_9BACL|nr:DUF1700 domain-containing protein [Paenibacillus mendelii]MCQ6562466.1 DUF1700 domain-containing protein [Paenibacillus mendelii]
MIKEQYLQQLWGQLSKVPEPQRRELMFDYEDHFRIAAEHGRSEEEAARELGDPQVIARELMLSYRVVEAENGGGVVRVSKAVLATVGLGFFNLIFVLGPYIALLGVLLAFWAVSVALGILAAGVMYEGIFGQGIPLLQASFMAMTALGIGMLAGVGTHKLTRSVFKITLKYLRFNSRVMGGRDK